MVAEFYVFLDTYLLGPQARVDPGHFEVRRVDVVFQRIANRFPAFHKRIRDDFGQ